MLFTSRSVYGKYLYKCFAPLTWRQLPAVVQLDVIVSMSNSAALVFWRSDSMSKQIEVGTLNLAMASVPLHKQYDQLVLMSLNIRV